MASILIPEEEQGKVQNVTCYDPSAGSGTLLMSIAHAIGEDRCTIYTQDISQKSSTLLRLNLILNNLVHSIQNVIQGNTLLLPYHKDIMSLMKFDYIVSNPPFKMDFSDYRNDLDSKENNERFFAGIPKIPKQAKDKKSPKLPPTFFATIHRTNRLTIITEPTTADTNWLGAMLEANVPMATEVAPKRVSPKYPVKRCPRVTLP